MTTMATPLSAVSTTREESSLRVLMASTSHPHLKSAIGPERKNLHGQYTDDIWVAIRAKEENLEYLLNIFEFFL